MKDVVRLSIKAAKIDVYTDTFKVLVKYDDHYILENVCTDIYQKCVQSIRDKCFVDNLSFSDYIENISGDNLDIQNIVVKRLKVELVALDEKVETENAIMKFERKLKEVEERKNSDITQLREDTEKKLKQVEERKNSDITELRNGTEKKVSSLKRKLEEIDGWKAKKSCEMEEFKELVENAATKDDFEDMEGID